MIVYKYVLFNNLMDIDSDTITVKMPRGARILKFDRQGNHFCLWALVDIDNDMEDRKFNLIFTGKDFDDKNKCYAGTVRYEPLSTVIHVFEECPSFEMDLGRCE